MKIILPWPDKRVFPNWRQSHHWRTYAEPVKAQRADSCVLATLALPLSEKRALRATEGRIDISVTFYPPDKRNRDDDGLIGAFKSARDGIADALGIDDRCFRPVYYFADPEKPGRIEVDLSPLFDRTQREHSLNSAESAINNAGRESVCALDPSPAQSAIQERTE